MWLHSVLDSNATIVLNVFCPPCMRKDVLSHRLHFLNVFCPAWRENCCHHLSKLTMTEMNSGKMKEKAQPGKGIGTESDLLGRREEVGWGKGKVNYFGGSMDNEKGSSRSFSREDSRK